MLASLRRPATVGGRGVLIVVSIACVAAFVSIPHGHGMTFGPYRVDLDVYRLGGRAWLNGMHLYGRLPTTMSGDTLPFTYPPLAAVVFSPLAMVPMEVASVGLTLASVGLLTVALAVCLRCLGWDRAGQHSAGWAVGWLLPPVLFLEPVFNSLAYGQINILLMALVIFDCLTPSPRWPRGSLVGIAAAVKLTPAAFVLFFLLRRDWRAAATTGASFLAATGLGFVLSWHDSVQYWTTTVFDTSRAGRLSYGTNQSIVGLLSRLGLGQPVPSIAWVVAAALVAAAAVQGMRRALAVSDDCLALSLNAFAALLISPVSWTHHWVWCVPALLALAAAGQRRRAGAATAMAVAGIVVFASWSPWWLPRGHLRELDWSGWQQVVGNSYVAFAGAIIVVAALGMFGLAARPARDAVSARPEKLTLVAWLPAPAAADSAGQKEHLGKPERPRTSGLQRSKTPRSDIDL